MLLLVRIQRNKRLYQKSNFVVSETNNFNMITFCIIRKGCDSKNKLFSRSDNLRDQLYVVFLCYMETILACKQQVRTLRVYIQFQETTLKYEKR